MARLGKARICFMVRKSVLVSNEELLRIIDRELDRMTFDTPLQGTTTSDEAQAIFEEIAIAAAHEGNPKHLGVLLAGGQLSPAGVQVAAEILKSTKPKRNRRGAPPRPFMQRWERSPTFRAAHELPDIVTILRRRYPDWGTGYRELAINLAALRNDIEADTLRNHLKRARKTKFDRA
jgi:hypothetical protein